MIDAFRAMGLIDRTEARKYQLSNFSAADFLQNEKFGEPVGLLRSDASVAGAYA